MERRLSAIFAADMVGYSRLMEADEVGTLARQKIHRRELIDPALAEFHGRLVKEMGDGILVEFPSVVDAVQCAVAIQRAMPERETDVTEDRRIAYRVGINLGDIIVEDNDIYGDGVNIAARLEQLAEPGGICISGTAYDQMRATVEVGYESLGEQRVKNIERPIRAYKVLTETDEAGIVIEKSRKTIRPRRFAILGLLVLLTIGAGGWWFLQPDFEPADLKQFAFEIPEKPSIAVLPFDNLTGDKSQEFFSDGLTENIIFVLASHPKLFVIARNSSFSFKGRAVKVQEVAEQLGVRFILQGSVQKDGNQLRVTAQLIDALAGNLLWVERYDRDINDPFDIQDNIARNLFHELNIQLVSGISAKPSLRDIGNLEAFRLYQSATVDFQSFEFQRLEPAEQSLLKALELSPHSVSIRTLLAWIYWYKAVLGGPVDAQRNLAVARKYAEEATRLDESFGGPYMVLGWLELYEKNYGAAEKFVERALEISSATGTSASLAGWAYSAMGYPRKGIELLRLGMRTEPYYPAWVAQSLAFSLMMVNEYDEAKEIANAVASSPTASPLVKLVSRLQLAAISVYGGDTSSATEYIQAILKTMPNLSVAQHAKIYHYIRDQEFYRGYLDALRLAGLPKHQPLKLPDEPSIAVLPFNNLSDDKSQQYFVDGMVEDLITDLSKVPGLFVIARNSSFAYRGKSVDVKQVARELGVRHVLEGSVRRSGNRVRINAQLIDGQTNSHVWAERYDGTLEDVFDLQDRITSEIIDALKLEFSANARALASAAKTNNTQAYDLFLKGRIERQRLNGEGYSNAIRLFERAVEIDSEFSQAHAELAFAYFDGVFRGLLRDVGLVDEQEAFARASDHLDLAFRNPTPLAYITKGYMTGVVQRQYDRSLATARRAIEIDPNFAEGYVHVASRAALAGDSGEALKLLEVARRLDPQLRAEFHQVMGMTYYINEQYEAARAALEKAVDRNPHDAFALQLLIAVYGHFDQAEIAESTLSTFNGLIEGTGSTGLVAASAFLWPFKDTAVAERLYHDFKAAGLPDPKPSLDPLMIERELKPSEAKRLMAPSTTSGVMVVNTGQQIPYSQRMARDGSSSFSVWGTTWNIIWSFDADGVRSERGDLFVYKLSDAGRKKWNRQYVIYEKSFNAYYYFDVVN